MKRTFLPRSRKALTIKSTVMISRKLPMCTVPDGVIPDAHVYSSMSPLCSIILLACWSAQWHNSFSFRSVLIMLYYRKKINFREQPIFAIFWTTSPAHRRKRKPTDQPAIRGSGSRLQSRGPPQDQAPTVRRSETCFLLPLSISIHFY